MNQLSSEPIAGEHPLRAFTPPAASRLALTLVAWIGTLLLSKLPMVVAIDLLGGDAPWIFPAWMVVAGALIAGTFLLPAIRPLTVYFTIMALIVLVAFGIDPAIRQTAFWGRLFENRPEIVNVFGVRVLLVLETIVVVAALFLLGVNRREAYLAVGDLRAPVGGNGGTTGSRRLRWYVLGPVAAVGLGGLFFAFMATQNPGAIANSAPAMRWLPLILVSAGLNAFAEEVTYRAAPMSTLQRSVGPLHALLLTSLWFGLGHYYGGIPSGPVGLIQSGLVALLMGRAMLDTRGLGWPWIIHVVLDAVIYFFIVVTMIV